jgi:hypothetical protein
VCPSFRRCLEALNDYFEGVAFYKVPREKTNLPKTPRRREIVGSRAHKASRPWLRTWGPGLLVPPAVHLPLGALSKAPAEDEGRIHQPLGEAAVPTLLLGECKGACKITQRACIVEPSLQQGRLLLLGTPRLGDRCKGRAQCTAVYRETRIRNGHMDVYVMLCATIRITHSAAIAAESIQGCTSLQGNGSVWQDDGLLQGHTDGIPDARSCEAVEPQPHGGEGNAAVQLPWDQHR